MKKFIISEEERKHIMGLYEQTEPSGQTEPVEVILRGYLKIGLKKLITIKLKQLKSIKEYYL